MKTENITPFNRAQAEAGAEYQCRNGFKAKILEWVGDRAIGYFLSARGEAFAAQWNEYGAEANDFIHADAHNLVMAPVGPVYPETTMGHYELYNVYRDAMKSLGYNEISAESKGLKAVANAAIARFIEDEQIPKAKGRA